MKGFSARRAASIGTMRPGTLVEAFAGDPWLCLLESRGTGGRCDYLCAEPLIVLRSRRERVWMGPPGAERAGPGCAFEAIRGLLARHRVEEEERDLPPFRGGLAGYLGYELLYRIEDIPDTGRDDRPMPDCALGLYSWVISHDRERGRTWLVANGFGPTAAEAEADAVRRLARVRRRLEAFADLTFSLQPSSQEAAPPADRRPRTADSRPAWGRTPEPSPSGWEDLDLAPVCTRDDYLRMVAEVKGHIEAGDVFEVCTSQRFDGTFDGEGLDLYRVVAALAQAPFSAYLRTPDGEVICGSPERFLRMDRDGGVQSRPMKGTRPRGATPEEDGRLREDLETSAKDAAELLMITDLVRNDLGRVCAFGTVRVPDEGSVEGYPFTWQRASTVTGRLRPELDAVDLVRAAFPGGSMTGAPKVEAMTIIDRLEPVKRGVFAGSVGFFDLGGALDLNIVIRTLIKQGQTVHFHVGGAVVADSDPEAEYQETLDKAAGLVRALRLA